MTIDSVDAGERLRAERAMRPDEYWTRVAEAGTDVPVGEWFNAAHEACDRWARDPSRVAIVFRGPDGRDEWTYARLRDASMRLAAAFGASGLRRGDRVAGLLTTQPEAYVTALACWRAGLIYVPLFVGLGSAALAHRIRSAGPRAVVLAAERRASWRDAATVDPDAKAAAEDCRVWCLGPDGAEPGEDDATAIIHGGGPAAPEPAFPTVRTRVDDPATIMFTSGTTGPPKGCVMPHSIPLLNRPFIDHCIALRPGDVLFSGADPGWSYGLYTVGFSVLATGQRIVVVPGGFDPQRWLGAMADEAVTVVGAAPSALRRLAKVAADTTGALPPTVRGATSGGEPLEEALVRAWRELGGGDIRDGYGQTEAAMLLANVEGGPDLVPGALGAEVPGFDVALLPEHGGTEPLTGEARGVIAVRRPRYQGSVTYWRDPEKWAARWRADWFVTGDVARRDADGRYWFVGRDDDLIVTSGYNVGPTEVESVLLAHPDVREAAVVGAPDPARGRVVRAVLVVDPGADTDALTPELQRAVRAQVGRHAYPRIVDYTDRLPRTESGKVRRAVLRDGYPPRAGTAATPPAEEDR